MEKEVNIYKEKMLDKNSFCITWELIPGRGAFAKAQEDVFIKAEQAAKGGKVHGLTLTDNPGGNPAISAEFLGIEVKKLGIEPLVHFTCKDKSRNEIESMLYAMTRGNVRNLLVMTGDYPVSGFHGRSKPVFDLDPINVIRLIEEMNQGLEFQALGKTQKLAPTDFFAGVCVSPFKQTEAELMIQYYKLKKKLQAGAKFVITQLGYDARKFHEVIQFMKVNGYEDIPVIGNIYILPYPTARLMNKNQIPGCVVTEELLAVLAKEREAEDKGKAARITRAAKMYAFMKGMGFAGVHIGGHNIPYEMVEEIIERGEEMASNWQDYIHEFDFPQKNGFYYFEKDPKTGLNTDIRTDTSYPIPRKTIFYRFCRLVHNLVFEKKSPIFKPLQLTARVIDSTPLKKPFGFFEHLMKVILFDCMNCGDCALFDVAFYCPMSQCPKNQRNGGCGGSYEGWCEVYPNEKKCVYVRAYERLKSYKVQDSLAEYIVEPCNWDLNHTPSWLNFYMGRDHTAKRTGVEPPGKKKES